MGSYTFRVVVSDGTATDDEVITVTVNPAVPACPTLVFTPATGTVLAAGTVGIAYSQTVSTSVTGYTFSATGLPAGLTMNAASGVIGGSPTAAVSNAAITVTATKGECTASANYTLTISPASTPPAGVAVYRINAGGPAVGQFAADQYFVPGPGDKYTSPNPISGTSTPAIYQSERWGNKQLGYAFPVTNGQYTVVLHFAEIAFSAPGQRVFDVSLENQKVLTAYDIFQRVGANTATSESFLVSVSDGVLNLLLSSLNPGNIENPKISAIEVISASGPSTASVASTAVKVNEKMYEKSIAMPVLEAYPNPFSARTTVHFRAAEAGKAQLLVYNALGQLVKTLHDDAVEAGQRYERVLSGTELPEGVYTCRLLLNGKWYTQRLILSK